MTPRDQITWQGVCYFDHFLF